MEAGPKAAQRSRQPSLQGLRESRAARRPPPHGNAAWRGAEASEAFSAQNASESECRQSRPSVIRRSRKKGFAERSLWAAQPHKGVSEPAVDTWCLISAVAIRKAPSSPNDCRSPVWNTGRFAAMNIAACAGAKPYAPRNADNTVP